MSDNSPPGAPDTVLVVEGDVIARLGIAEYLRHCGYRVIEAVSAVEAIIVLTMTPILTVSAILSAVEMEGPMDGFGLYRWVRANRPGVEVLLAGNVVKAAQEAGDLCEEGPHLKRPYEPEQVVGWIKKLRNLRSSDA